MNRLKTANFAQYKEELRTRAPYPEPWEKNEGLSIWNDQSES